MEVNKQERKQLKDIIHKHPFILQQFIYGNNQPTRWCKACLDEILSGPFYTCTSSSEGCNSFLHKYCGDLPLEVQDHPLHSQHTLCMGSIDFELFCSACEEPCSPGYVYACEECRFAIDVKCATLNNRKIKHKCHKHPLTPQNRPILSYCDACGIKHEGVFYQCTKCVCYWIHRDCASLPETIKHRHHVHTLDLFYALPEDVDPDEDSCKICSEDIFRLTREDADNSTRQVCWVYYCKGCRYVAHVNCAASKIEPFMQILLPPINVESRNIYIDPNAFRFPMEGVVNELASVSMISRFLVNKDDDDSNNKETTITHWSHPHHPLIFHEEPLFGENGSPFAKKSFVLNKCDGCGRAITASPFWRCSESECHFFLHKCCAHLRHSILGHTSHDPQHQLVLRTKPLEFFRAFECGCCQNLFNGIAYQCKESSCQFYMDVECAAAASLPSTAIIHEAHPHHQLVVRKVNEECNCCGDYIYPYESIYGCETCKFNLHMRCVIYSNSINHRFDKHPFKLTYIPLESQREEDSYCEICEKFIDPLRWFYSCPDCDRFMHPRCLFSIDEWYPKLNYFEYSEDYKVDCHPHQLTFDYYAYKVRCDHCDQEDATLQQEDEVDPSRRWLGFRCNRCGYWIQARCAISCNLRKGKKLMNFPQLP